MKPTVVLIALLAAGVGTAYAQKPAPAVGIMVAYGRDRILSNNQYTSVSHSAYQAGLTADAYVSSSFSFHPEVLYTMRYFDTSNDEDLNRDLTTIDVPLLARYHAGGLYLEAGPEIDVPIKAVNEAGDNVKSEVNSIALNYVAGVGYRFGHGPSLGVRYDGGASNVFKSNATTVLGAGKFKSSAVFVVLGYSFGG
ncbi:outer membrane beta-barrel protein [Hymenobacter negativus]|uniref:PorT family protein n=1 Tax=Hymenobacter negativus TaxID=2795026 RepID=A0ABS3QLC1_9BACT|nr:outer membrane beta-barrel protein [Hymenobacter negativus]MBO2012059.1 PorT family protein [Hymenobacter negativus]